MLPVREGALIVRAYKIRNGQREMRVDEFLKLRVALRIDPRSFVTRNMVDEINERIFREDK